MIRIGPARSVAMCIFGALVAAMASGTTTSAQEDPSDTRRERISARSGNQYPLAFDDEIIRIRVLPDSLEIEGFYRFAVTAGGTGSVSLLYPYPADSLLAGARTLSLELRTPDTEWRRCEFREQGRRSAVVWRIPATVADTLLVRTVYRQARLGDYGRYIVTTTQAWGRPLTHARFEIRLPAGAEPDRFSYPFEVRRDGEGNFYLYEARDFLPERDIVFTWHP